MKHLIFVKAKFPQPHNAFGSYLSSMAVVLFPSHARAQKTHNWEIGTSFGFSLGTFEDEVNIPGVGDMTKQSDLWYPGVRLAYRRFSNKKWPSLSFIAEYQRSRASFDRLVAMETLGVTREQTNVVAHVHYLSVGAKLNFKAYQRNNNTFLVGFGLSYMTNFINELEVVRTRERALADTEVERFYVRENRYDDKTEDFEKNPFAVFSFHTAYERNYGRFGYRLFVELNIATQHIDSEYYSDSNTLRFLKIGAAILL